MKKREKSCNAKPLKFTVHDLRIVIEECGAPTIKETGPAILIAAEVLRIGEAKETLPMLSPGIEDALKWHKELLESWLKMEKLLPRAIEAKRGQVSDWRQSELAYRDQFLSETIEKLRTLEVLSDVLKNAKSAMFWPARKKKGQRGASSVFHPLPITNIFNLLEEAWAEAGSRYTNKNKRYEIISRSLAKIGVEIEVDAIRKAVGKTLAENKDFEEHLGHLFVDDKF